MKRASLLAAAPHVELLCGIVDGLADEGGNHLTAGAEVAGRAVDIVKLQCAAGDSGLFLKIADFELPHELAPAVGRFGEGGEEFILAQGDYVEGVLARQRVAACGAYIYQTFDFLLSGLAHGVEKIGVDEIVLTEEVALLPNT